MKLRTLMELCVTLDEFAGLPIFRLEKLDLTSLAVVDSHSSPASLLLVMSLTSVPSFVFTSPVQSAASYSLPWLPRYRRSLSQYIKIT